MASVDYPELIRYEREEFLREVWDYNAGEHVSFLGPTGSGKTTFAFQLLEYTATPKLPAIVLVMKPRDSTVTKWMKKLKFRRVVSWPPMFNPLYPSKPAGWVLWPKFSFNADLDDARLAREFDKAISESYRKGDRIIFADEVRGLVDELGLKRLTVQIWNRGRSMGAAMWTATQRPAWVPPEMYGAAEHLFLHNDPDKRSRDRYAEIGGVDPELLKHHVVKLDKHEWIYCRRSDGALCIVGA